MKIHEYQAKSLLKKFGVSVADGKVIENTSQAQEAAQNLGGEIWAVKAQIHAGGRGKGGGIKIAKSLQEVEEFSKKLLGSSLITPQTGPNGQIVHKIYIEKGASIAQELYFSLIVDRLSGRIMAILSSAGGMDIEQVAKEMPDQIHKISFDPLFGFQPFHGRQLAFKIGLSDKKANQVIHLMIKTYETFKNLDANLIEINPLALTQEGKAIALDAKIIIDDNALFRHPDIEELRDLSEEDPLELEATRHSLNYIKLEGNIGCLVNGAGLAMATMDAIKLEGGNPANFLDVGGGAPKERVTKAFQLILSDPQVSGILVNIFGGIMRCDIIAEGIIAAAREIDLKIPLVVRLQGTNVKLGQEILESSGISIIAADDLGDAARKIVKAVQEKI